VIDLFGNETPSSVELVYRAKVLRSCLASVGKARQRRAEKDKPVAVDLTPQQILVLLEHQGYRCALTRQRFWVDDSDRFGPSMPSIDRVVHDGPYSYGNVRIILTGINGLRGRGSDRDMYRNARALIANQPAGNTEK